jgi:hypothetical protein
LLGFLTRARKPGRWAGKNSSAGFFPVPYEQLNNVGTVWFPAAARARLTGVAADSLQDWFCLERALMEDLQDMSGAAATQLAPFFSLGQGSLQGSQPAPDAQARPSA